MPRSKHSKKLPSQPGLKRRALIKALELLEKRQDALEKGLQDLILIIHRQATVIAEAVYGIQLLMQKGIITKDELSEIKQTLLHANSILGEGSDIQPKETGTDVDSGGSEQSGLFGDPSDRRDSDGCEGSQEGTSRSGDLLEVLEQSNPDPVTGESQKPAMMGPTEHPHPYKIDKRESFTE